MLDGAQRVPARIVCSLLLSCVSRCSLLLSLRFRVGPQEVHNFRMIERHYHNGTGALMKSYDFNFSFCIPNSTNEWEAIYDVRLTLKRHARERLVTVAGTRSDFLTRVICLSFLVVHVRCLL